MVKSHNGENFAFYYLLQNDQLFATIHKLVSNPFSQNETEFSTLEISETKSIFRSLQPGVNFSFKNKYNRKYLSSDANADKQALETNLRLRLRDEPQ